MEVNVGQQDKMSEVDSGVKKVKLLMSLYKLSILTMNSKNGCLDESDKVLQFKSRLNGTDFILSKDLKRF